MTNQPDQPERSDLLEALSKQRAFLRQTVQGLSDEQAVKRTTSSELCLAGIIKHVASTEQQWIDFLLRGPEVMAFSPENMKAHAETFQVLPEETLADLLARYDEVANRTAQVISELRSLDESQPLPDAPWFPSGARWTARMVLVHVLAETAQHSGHADIIRESLDGAKTMG
jgi:uncharacterized damage-inducible protein DinB